MVEDRELPYEYFIEAELTVTGVELWGWAAGVPGMTAHDFVEAPGELTLDPPIPSLTSALFPNLPERVDTHDNQAGA